jgi:hypothetical protein
LLDEILKNKELAAEQITLAARNLNDLPDEEVIAILNDLAKLGVLTKGE